MLNFWRIIKISRPIGYIAGPALVFLGTIIQTKIAITPLIVLHSLMLTFPACFLVFGINDVYDMETDRRNPRKGGMQGAILKEAEVSDVLSIARVCVLLVSLPALLQPSFLNVIATFILVFLAWAYSVPPLRLKEKPPLDSISDALGFFAIVLMALSYGPGLAGFPHKGYYLLLGVVGMHSYSTIMDYTPDKDAGSITFAVKYGKRGTALTSLLVFLILLFLSGISNWIILLYFKLWIFVALVTFLWPNEKVARTGTYFLCVTIVLFSTGYIFYIST